MTPPLDLAPGATFRRPGRGGGRLLLGVCAGLARRWDLDPRTVRIAFAITLVPFGAGLLVYAALSVVMPADGASDRAAGRRGELGRSLAQALVVLGGVFGVALIGVLSTVLALFGLSSVALLLASATLTAVIVVRHGRAWLFGVVTLALAVPAAACVLTNTTIARQTGRHVVAITQPADVNPTAYRAGAGPMLLDLRTFSADDGTTTTISARADLRPLVVALPTDRCFNLVVDYRLQRTWVGRLVDGSSSGRTWIGSDEGYGLQRPAVVTGRAAPIPGLIAYGKAIPSLSGEYRRPVAQTSAPTIHLVLSSGRDQIVVRDFPAQLDPLAHPTWPASARRPESLAAIVGKLPAASPTDEAARVKLGSGGILAHIHVASGDFTRTSGGDPRSVPGNALARDLGTLTTPQLSAVAKTASRLSRRAMWPSGEATRVAGGCASALETTTIGQRLAAAQRRTDRRDRVLIAHDPSLASRAPLVKLAYRVMEAHTARQTDNLLARANASRSLAVVR